MSTLQTINVKHPSSGSNNVVLDSSGNTTVSGALTVSGNATITGTLQANGVSGTIYPLTLMTAQASTSGTFIDFTGIPSWVRRATVIFNSVSTNGSSNLQVQLGAGSFSTTGYVTVATSMAGTALTTVGTTSGFVMPVSSAATNISGNVVFTTVGSNIWLGSGVFRYASNGMGLTSGDIALGGTLDRIRITTVNGTDVFDAGSINVLYE